MGGLSLTINSFWYDLHCRIGIGIKWPSEYPPFYFKVSWKLLNRMTRSPRIPSSYSDWKWIFRLYPPFYSNVSRKCWNRMGGILGGDFISTRLGNVEIKSEKKVWTFFLHSIPQIPGNDWIELHSTRPHSIPQIPGNYWIELGGPRKIILDS